MRTWAAFYSFGTCRLNAPPYKPGRANAQLLTEAERDLLAVMEVYP